MAPPTHAGPPPRAPAPPVVFTDVRLFDGSGSLPEPAALRVENGRIAAIARGPGARLPADGAQVVDGRGGVLMPGLIDAHVHLALGSSTELINPPRDRSDAETALLIAHGGRVMLDAGYTAGYSGGSASMHAEVAAAAAFDAGWVPGPRLVTSSIERVPGGAMGLAVKFPGRGVRAPDPAARAGFVAQAHAAGVKAVKFLLNGVSAFDAGSNQGEQFHPEEIAAAAEAAHRLGLWLTAHCYTAESIHLALRHGFRMLYHCTYADPEALDAIAAAKDRVFVGLAPGIVEADLLRGPRFGIMASPADRAEQADAAERVKAVGRALRERGVRSLPGGDYGFPWNPVGTNARELQLFVDWFGYTPAQALHAATAQAAQALDMAERIGQLREGYLADLLLVDGDPCADIGLLAQTRTLRAIMKDGRWHKAPGG